MPVTDGLELLHEIKTHSAGTEGIALLRGLDAAVCRPELACRWG
jgi:hypothetical protein